MTPGHSQPGTGPHSCDPVSLLAAAPLMTRSAPAGLRWGCLSPRVSRTAVCPLPQGAVSQASSWGRYERPSRSFSGAGLSSGPWGVQAVKTTLSTQLVGCLPPEPAPPLAENPSRATKPDTCY